MVKFIWCHNNIFLRTFQEPYFKHFFKDNDNVTLFIEFLFNYTTLNLTIFNHTYRKPILFSVFSLIVYTDYKKESA